MMERPQRLKVGMHGWLIQVDKQGRFRLRGEVQARGWRDGGDDGQGGDPLPEPPHPLLSRS